ncbi:MAG: hypothetical protein K8S56_10925, partial [Candidatus Cloacimonetes bacterium]|nr:hypothetical protein [Candidatus Cloacimonadota bacterium]
LQDEKEPTKLRRKATHTLFDLNDNQLKTLIDFYYKTKNVKVKARTLDALIRADFSKSEQLVQPILTKPDEFSIDEIKVVISRIRLEYAKKYVHEIASIAQNINSKKTYGICMSKLGEINTFESVIAYLNSLNRFHFQIPDDNKTISWRLAPSQAAIEKMINPEQSDYLILWGLKAIHIGKQPFEVEIINQIKSTTRNEEIVRECNLALESIAEKEYWKGLTPRYKRRYKEYRGEK